MCEDLDAALAAADVRGRKGTAGPQLAAVARWPRRRVHPGRRGMPSTKRSRWIPTGVLARQPFTRETEMTVERYCDDARDGDECVSPSVTVTAAISTLTPI